MVKRMKGATMRVFYALLLLSSCLHSPCDARSVGRRGEQVRSSLLRNKLKLKERRKHCKDRSKAFVRGKESGKAATCSPTASPSVAPSNAPSDSPSGTPSTDPSAAPSEKPSLSMDPSSFPSLAPSESPSTDPSSEPSAEPSQSPSTDPSSTPSLTPSGTPSSVPSSDPSSHPSDVPSNSPSSHPSESPSTEPSSLPSSVPSLSPSNEPTATPTKSAAPSVSMNPTASKITTFSVGSRVQSTCVAPEPSERLGGNFNEYQLLVFQYLLFVPGTVLEVDDKQDIVDEMEKKIHEGLIRRFLTCDLGESDGSSNDEIDDFYIWSISPSPPDSIPSQVCDADLVAETDPSLPDDSMCMVVQAALEMQVYFPPVRRHRILSEEKTRELEPVATTMADPQVVSASGDYLIEAMSQGVFNDDKVLQTRFLGFVTEENVHVMVGSSGGAMNVAGAEGYWMAQGPKSRLVGGAMTMAAAAACLVIVTALILHRRKTQSDALWKHIDGMSTFSGFKDEYDDPGTEILGDGTNSLGWFSDDFLQRGLSYFEERDKNRNGALSLDRQHDVHRCTSAFCTVCLKEQNPTFISTKASNIPDILEDLRAFGVIEDDNSFSSSKHPDTVVL